MQSPGQQLAGIAGLLWFLIAPSVISVAGTPPGGDNNAYPQLLIQPFTEFRLSFAKRPGYFGNWTQEPEREAVTKALEGRQSAEFLALSAPWLEKCPVDARIHLARASQLSHGGDVVGATYHRMMFYGLLASIMSSGNGQSKDSAYKVISVEEEYTLMNYLGAQLKVQSLDSHYDVMNVDLGGKPITMYFDISIPLEAMAEQFNGKQKKP